MFFPQLSYANNLSCASEFYDETHQVKSNHDGDTLRLKNGQAVRLIGVNTPELATKQHFAQAKAVAAKNKLSQYLQHSNSIKLVLGEQKRDHYKRRLAHIFLADGRNVQASLLAQGLAYALFLPPNTKFSACYLAQERIGRCHRRGLWRDHVLLEAKKLSAKNQGFALIKGKLTKIVNNKKGIWLTLDNDLTVRIHYKNKHLFKLNKIKAMRNQQVVVRGWLNLSKQLKLRNSTKFYLRLYHPYSIMRFDKFSCR